MDIFGKRVYFYIAYRSDPAAVCFQLHYYATALNQIHGSKGYRPPPGVTRAFTIGSKTSIYTRGGNPKPGIKDLCFYLSTVAGNVLGKGQVSISHCTTAPSLLTTQWMADKLASATFNLTRFYVGEEQGQ